MSISTIQIRYLRLPHQPMRACGGIRRTFRVYGRTTATWKHTRWSLVCCIHIFPLLLYMLTPVDTYTQEDIDSMADQFYEFMELPDTDPEKPSRLNAIGLLLHVRFRLKGDIFDIRHAITAQESAINLISDDHPDKPVWLGSLGNSQHALLQYKGFEEIALNCISTFRRAVSLTPDDDETKPERLAKLAGALYVHYCCFFNITYLQEALDIMDKVTISYSDHPKWASWLSSEGGMHLALYHHLGQMDDLDNSIACYEFALQNFGEGQDNEPHHLSQAGSAFHARFKRLQRLPDLERSLALHEQAAGMAQPSHVKADRLVSFAQALHSAYGLHHDITNLEKGIRVAREAVESTNKQHPRRISMMNTLGTLLREHFESTKDLADLNEAIKILKHEAHMTPSDHPEFKVATVELGHALLARFQWEGDLHDIERAIAELKDALLLTANNDLSRPALLNDLGDALIAHYRVSKEDSAIRSAVEYYSEGATSGLGAPAIRLSSAMKWANTLSTLGSSPLVAYEHALELLSKVAWMGLPMTDRYAQIIPYNDLVCNAAAVAIRERQYTQALEWLEQGRSIVWGQILQLRSAVDELSLKDPELAQKFVEVSKELEFLSNPRLQIPHEHSLSVEETEQKHRSLAQRWQDLVNQIQSLHGFEEFLKPKPASRLVKAAKYGPVVVLNASEHGCDALIIMTQSSHLQHVALPTLSMSTAKHLQDKLCHLLLDAGIKVRKERAAKLVKHLPLEKLEFPEILAQLWNSVVFPVIKAMGLEVSLLCSMALYQYLIMVLQDAKSGELPHIFWCLTGPLTTLPLHAAGLYDAPLPGPKLSDYAISSYIPTLASLLDRVDRSPVTEPKILAICQTSTPGQAPLHAAEIEIRTISQCIRKGVTTLKDSAATIEAVLKAMEDCNWIHLACHGVQDMAEPTSSAIILWDGRLTLAEIIKKSLNQAEFAFLSACETATGDTKLSEEAVHLAAGMLLAGYKGVIATMWSIQDQDGPTVAQAVYSQLVDGGVPNSMSAAEALHQATLQLQKQGASFERWVPFIHMGV